MKHQSLEKKISENTKSFTTHRKAGDINSFEDIIEWIKPIAIVNLYCTGYDNVSINLKSVNGMDIRLMLKDIHKVEDCYAYRVDTTLAQTLPEGLAARALIKHRVIFFRICNKTISKRGRVSERRESDKKQQDIDKFMYATKYNAKSRLINSGTMYFYDDKLIYSPNRKTERAIIPARTEGFYPFRAFAGNNDVKEIIYNTNVSVPREFALYSNVEKVNITGKVSEIGPEAFRFCRSIKEVIIPDSLRKIGLSCFSGAFNLSKLEFTGKLSYLGREAFVGCENLRSLKLPNGFESILPGTFTDMTNLEELFIPKSVKYIDKNNFNNTKKVIITAPRHLEKDLKSVSQGISNRRLRLY